MDRAERQRRATYRTRTVNVLRETRANVPPFLSVPILIHRDIPGEHVWGSPHCWCCPMVVHSNDRRTVSEIIAAAEVRHLPN